MSWALQISSLRLIVSIADDQPIHRLGDVSSHRQDPHLGYLLKHAQLRFFELGAVALAPLGISGREAAVLRAIDACRPVSQGELARAMNVDRTTMVALIDDLQLKGLVQRRQDPDDRRKNVVELTDAGCGTVREAAGAVGQAERDFLAPLSAAEAAQFKKILRLLLLEDTDRSDAAG
jgi:DNA-binding MarR family transcriptional regulator